MIKILSQTEIIEYIATNDVSEDVCISIGDPGTIIPTCIPESVKDYLRLEFYDLHREEDGIIRHQLPNEDAIRNTVEFILQHKISKPNYLIHCNAGIGRSPAFGIIVLAIHGYSDEEIISTIRAVRPQSMPNELVVSIASKVISRNLKAVCNTIRELRIKDMKNKIESRISDIDNQVI